MIFKPQAMLLQLLPLLLLLLQLLQLGSAQIPKSNRAVGDFDFGFLDNTRYIDRVSVRVPYNPANTSLTLKCKVKAPRQFVVWMRGFVVAGITPQLQLNLTPKSYEEMYQCIMVDPAKPKEYLAIKYVVNEMPSIDDSSVIQRTVPLRSGVRLNCPVEFQNGRTIAWYIYAIDKNRFVKLDRKKYTTESIADFIVIPYGHLSYPNDAGFTFYKCQLELTSTGQVDPSSKPAIFKVNKENLIDNANPNRPPQDRYEIHAQLVQSSICAIPTKVTYGSRASIFSFKAFDTKSVTWYFRRYIPDREDNEYVRLNETKNIGFTLWDERAVMSVAKFTEADEGYYMRVEKGASNMYAYVRLRDLVPYIKLGNDRTVYVSKNANEIKRVKCEIPVGGDVATAIWRVLPQQSAPFDIAIDGERNGFSVSRSGRNVVLQFSANLGFVGYRLQCHLGSRYDSTEIAKQ